MNKFLQKIVKFSIVPLFVFFGIEWYIQSVKENYLNEKSLQKIASSEVNDYAWINKLNQKQIKVLAGSSSVKYSLSCNLLNKLCDNKYQYVNIAQDARDPMVTYFIINSLNLKNIKTIYFALDPWIYTKSYYKNRNNILYYDFNLFQTIIFNSKYDNTTLKSRVSNLIFEQSLSSTKNFVIPEDFGSVVLEQNPTNFQDPKELFNLKTFGWSMIQFDYLKKIDALCKKNNIEFILFIPPKRSDFTQVYKKECKQIHKEYIELLNKCNLKLRIFGKFNDLEALGNKNNFADALHLNEKGQQIYTKLFFKISNSKLNTLSKKYKWF